MITKIDHVALSVANLERPLAFYADLIGSTVERILDCGPEMRLGDVNGLPGSTARIAHLRLGDAMLELFEYQHPRGRALPVDWKQADRGLIHLSLTSN